MNVWVLAGCLIGLILMMSACLFFIFYVFVATFVCAIAQLIKEKYKETIA